jgi:hypothetical protein
VERLWVIRRTTKNFILSATSWVGGTGIALTREATGNPFYGWFISIGMHHAFLREQAQVKREMAEQIRRILPSLSLTKDRLLLSSHAADLEADAIALEAQARVLEKRSSV